MNILSIKWDLINCFWLTAFISLSLKCIMPCLSTLPYEVDLRGYHTLQGDNSLKSVERFDHMMFVCRFQASR